MKSIVRQDSGADWKEHLRQLAKAEGIENPSDDGLRRLDRNRPDKKVSNQEWQSPTDPDSRIAKMKDGRTHLAYKAEHAVDLESQAIVAPLITHADRADVQSAPLSLTVAQANLLLAGHSAQAAQMVMDKGYHDNGLLADCAARGVRTYVPARRQKTRRWADKPADHETAFRANRRRVRTAKGRRLNRWRSERCERTFAQRSWLRGLANVSKHHTLKCAACNLRLGLLQAAQRQRWDGRFIWAFCILLAVVTCLAGWNADPLTLLYLFLAMFLLIFKLALPAKPTYHCAKTLSFSYWLSVQAIKKLKPARGMGRF